MQKSDNTQKAKSTRRKVKNSTTLNRKYVKKPHIDMSMVKTVEKSPQIRRFDTKMTSDEWSRQPEMSGAKQAAEMPESHPLQVRVNKKMQTRKSMQKNMRAEKRTAKELKDQAIQKALATAAMPEQKAEKSKKAKKDKFGKVHFGFGRVLLALSCATVAVLAIAYFVNLNMPDISLKVAAMQTGINAAYPNYVPRDYAISSITSEDKKIVLEFANSSTDSKFTLVEETSSWDSDALLNSYVKTTYGDSYTIVKEQGLTIFVSGSNATWVNGGIVYKITATNGTLTNKQIRSIATSM